MAVTVKVCFDDEAAERLDELQEAGDESSWADVLKSALGLYNWAYDRVRAGHSVGAFAIDKPLEELALFPMARGKSSRVQALTEDDAVLVVALRRFAERCAREGQPLTRLLTEKVVAMAKTVGVSASDPDLLLMEEWSDVTEAMRVVGESGNAERLFRLQTWLADLSLAEVKSLKLANLS